METHAGMDYGCVDAGFEPTYEGWKPFLCPPTAIQVGVLSLPMRDGNASNSATRASRAASFEPTYEGWKQPFTHSLHAFKMGFEPTYEGWKPEISPFSS